MATLSTLNKKPKGKLKPVVVRTEVVERVVDVPSTQTIIREPEPLNYNTILNALKADPDFLKKVKGEKGEKGEPGLGAGGGEGASQQKPSVKYIPVRSSTYTVDKKKLVAGQNIIGVNYDGPVTIYLPKRLHSFCTIHINDESGNASTNNITVKQVD